MSQIRDWGPIRTRLASFLERSMADQANQLVMLCMMYDISINCVRGRLELGKLFLFQLKNCNIACPFHILLISKTKTILENPLQILW